MAITGIGGLFFRARDPAALRAWYKTHLGINVGGVWNQAAGPTVLAPFAQDTSYFPADHAWMLNLRVDQLDPLLETLRAAGIAITTDPTWDTPETGRFARIHDPEGNPIELWEPPADD
ncbi:VOC family protein [Nitrospirillum sp. BR 11828]|uniref:VOC family protein n=1 Tax=Nitrospirillum sp. BR 11828 TaxID=3104325 RepID=UPI002ACA7A8E|nr:VOC family protein [Nitrospirillum sp. BR 11828]MDZ5646516.1 VOC family protein [Nitrospirillum sp. BR 11828]